MLDERPELAGAGIEPADLQGDIEFSNVTFRYAARARNAIEDLSFRIRQGENTSRSSGRPAAGSRPSTVLLLGFEQPTSGSVFLDGHDLSGLDMVAVRQRLGVVLQNGRLVAGSIYENIAGMAPLSPDDAWAAARAAALDDDIQGDADEDAHGGPGRRRWDSRSGKNSGCSSLGRSPAGRASCCSTRRLARSTTARRRSYRRH